MLRSFGIAAALFAFAVTGAAAAEHVDAANNFKITIPDGWTTDTPLNPSVKLKIQSPRYEQTRGLCNVFTTPAEMSRGKSQADIDAQGEKIDENFWLTALQSAKIVKSATIESHGKKLVNGHTAYFVVAVVTSTLSDGSEMTLKIQQMMELIPGQFFLVTCGGWNTDAGYPQEVGDFEVLLSSFAPLNDAVAMRSTDGVSSLTMYSQPNFGGVSRVVTQDTSDLATFGWRGPAASFSVAGGAWEVCDGANFAGKCQVVSGASASAAGTVLSARRAQAHAVQNEIAAALADAFARVR